MTLYPQIMWQNIPKVAFPVLKIWSVCGLPAYSLENGKFICKKSRLYLISILFLLIGFTIYLKFIGVRNRMSSLMTLIQIVSIYTQDFGLIWNVHVRRKDIECILNQILTLEKLLVQFSGTSFCSKNIVKKLWKFMIAQIILTIIVVTLTIVFLGYNLSRIMYTCAHYGAVIFGFNFELFVFFYLLLVIELYSQFNSAIQIKTTNTTEVMEHCFKSILQIYMLLYSTCTNFNQVLQKLILLKIFTDFLLAITTLYVGLYALVFVKTMVARICVMTATTACIVLILMADFCMAYFVEELIKQVNG